MTSATNNETITVIRNNRQRWFAIAVVLLMSALALEGVVHNAADGQLSDQLGYYFIMAIPTWLVWRAVACSRIVVTEFGLIVVNWFKVYSVPWAALDSIRAEEDLIIVLFGGRTIRPAVGSGSLAGAMHGSPEQRALRQRIERARLAAQPSREAVVVSRVDLYARLAVPVILVGAVIVTIVTVA